MSKVESQIESINSTVKILLAFNFTNEKYSWREELLNDVRKHFSKIGKILLCCGADISKEKFLIGDKNLLEIIEKLPSKKDIKSSKNEIEDINARKKNFNLILQKILGYVLAISENIQMNVLSDIDEDVLLFDLESIDDLLKNILDKVQKQNDKRSKIVSLKEKEIAIDATTIVEKEQDGNQSHNDETKNDKEDIQSNMEKIQNDSNKKLRIKKKKKKRTRGPKTKEGKEKKRNEKISNFKEKYNNKTLEIQNMEHSDYINSLFTQFDQKINDLRVDNDNFKKKFERQEKINQRTKKKLRKHKEKLKTIEDYFDLRETTSFIEDRVCRKYFKNNQYKKDKKSKILNLNLGGNKEWENVGLFFKEVRSNANDYAHIRPKNPKQTLDQLRDDIEKSTLQSKLKSYLINEVKDPKTLVDLKEYYNKAVENKN